ncbi:flavin reductase [Candidatus Peregrinibacteria bacterium]|nr:flavin reductase [Candidatus Peregrinibacteria bacterium]
MDLKFDDPRTILLATNVGLVTSDGLAGPNIMSVAWSYYVSCAPGMMAVCINPKHATYKNILKTKEFGLNICAADQAVLASVSGMASGAKVDKIKVLQELGFEFYTGSQIKPLMIKGASMNAECKVVKEIEIGDHTMFVGEVVDLKADTSKNSLVYANGKYWELGKQIEKPSEEKMNEIKALLEKFSKK